MKCLLRLALAALLWAVTARAAEMEWQPAADMDGQLFPAMLLATATMKIGVHEKLDPAALGDPTGLLGIVLKNAPPRAKVKVTLLENALMNASSFAMTLPEKHGDMSIAPKISYKFEQLRHVFQREPLEVTFAVEVDGVPLGEQTETINVHSIDDCPYGVADNEEALPDATKKSTKTSAQKKTAPGAGYTDLSWMFAAYVNENHPLIDTLLKEALDTKIVTGFDDYQSRSRTEVLRQVFAIWRALQDRGLRYSNTTATPGGSRLILSQHVRFLEDALRSRQANCVDGCVLLASVLRKIELDPFLILVPGHMYVGLYLDGNDQSEASLALDATALCDPENAHGAKLLPELKPLRKKLSAASSGPAWETFKAATAEATADFRAHQKKFATGRDPQYQIVDIANARDQGVMPIGYEKPAN